jgi:hypothetical protein
MLALHFRVLSCLVEESARLDTTVAFLVPLPNAVHIKGCKRRLLVVRSVYITQHPADDIHCSSALFF